MKSSTNTSDSFPTTKAVAALTIAATVLALFSARFVNVGQVLAMGALVMDQSEVVTASTLHVDTLPEWWKRSVAAGK